MNRASTSRNQMIGLVFLCAAACLFIAGLLLKKPILLGAGACCAGVSSIFLRLIHQQR